MILRWNEPCLDVLIRFCGLSRVGGKIGDEAWDDLGFVQVAGSMQSFNGRPCFQNAGGEITVAEWGNIMVAGHTSEDRDT